MNHPSILTINKHWLAVNKPAGLNVEQLWDYPSVEHQVKEYLRNLQSREPDLWIVHRLDRPVSGVLLLARKKSTLRQLNKQFADRTVQKTYWAMTAGTLPASAGTLTHYLIKDQKGKRAVAYAQARKGAVLAKLEYRVRSSNGKLSCVEIRPLGGKFHQIRVQLAAAGCPLIGDVKYGGSPVTWPDSIALHARELRFTHPQTGEKETVSAPLPTRNALWEAWV